MSKRYIRWILPFVVLVLIGTYFLVSPMLATHATGASVPGTHHQIIVPHGLTPDVLWHW